MTGQGPVRVDQHMASRAAAMLPGTITDTLRTRYKQLPVMTRTSGLAATYAFLVAKSGDDTDLGCAYGRVATGIREFLASSRGRARRVDTNNAMLVELTEMAPADYARAAVEVQLIAGWLSRLAEARFLDTPR